MEYTIISIGGLILFSLALSQIIFALSRKRQHTVAYWQKIIELTQGQRDRLPLLIEIAKRHQWKSHDVQALIAGRQKNWQTQQSPSFLKKHHQELQIKLQQFLAETKQHPSVSHDQAFLTVNRELIELSALIEKSISHYNQEVQRFERLRRLAFFSGLFNVKPLSKY